MGSTIHEHTLTLDTHVDIPLSYMAEVDAGQTTDLQVDLPKLEEGQVNAVFLIVFTPQGDLESEAYAAAKTTALTRISAIHKLVDSYPERAAIARSAEELRGIVQEGKRAILIGMENAYPLGATLQDLQMWYERGVRYCGLTHLGHNQFADSSDPIRGKHENEKHAGLSPVGKELVLTLNDLGIMVDVSHSSKKTMMQATALSKAPVIASHSGVMALAKHPRNLDDEQLRAMRDCGGVVQVVALSAYVKALTPEQVEFREKLGEKMGIRSFADFESSSEETQKEYLYQRNVAVYDLAPKASISEFVDHIDYVVEVIGIDYVGIASDFDGGGGLTGWGDASESANVTAELERCGYTEAEIAKIWGENFLRVMQQVQDAATQN